LGFVFLGFEIPELSRRLNVSLRKSLAPLVGLTLAASVFVLAPVTPAAAQDAPEGQEEALAYHAWFAANQQQDTVKAVTERFRLALLRLAWPLASKHQKG